MSPVEVVQVALGAAAVAVGGGVWFRLGAMGARLEDAERRLDRLEQDSRKLIGV